MKIEQVIVIHLFTKKIVTLQGIGTFHLDPSVAVPSDMEKEVPIPQNAVTFEYNPKATEDASLIDSIVQYTSKIKPLASSDLDSFLMLGRQFLNIGKPFTFGKLGTLDKAQNGTLIFIPGSFVTPKIEAPKTLKEDETEESSGLFNDYDTKRNDGGKKLLAVLVSIVVLALIGWAVYHFIFAKKPTAENNILTQQQLTTPDTLVKNNDTSKLSPDTTVKKDSLVSNFLDSPANNSALNIIDSSFNVVIKETSNKNLALTSFKRLKSWGHHVVMYTPDSINFKVAEVFNLPLSDTIRIKDSLSKFYHSAVYVERK